MSKEEEKTLWERISVRTFDAPVRKPILSRLYYGGLLPAIKIQNIHFQKKKYAFGAFASTIIISGSISAFAQAALPGDLLYLIKTNINEKLKVTLALTVEEKAEAEAILATKRLEETEALAIKGRLNPVIIKETSTAFKTHVDNFEKHLIELDKKAKFDSIKKIGVLFQTRIAVHTTILDEIESTIGNSTSSNIKNLNSLGTTTNSFVVTDIKKEVLQSVIPTVLITKKAFVATVPVPNEEKKDYKKINNQHFVPLEIDSEEARNYLKKIQEEVGIDTTKIISIPTPLVPTVVQ